jgi:hypothetical protein
METNCRVTELYLGWNNIWAPGGKAIASVLVQETHLRVVDLSWNVIGLIMCGNSSKPGNIGTCWGEVFEINKKLIHLDLSFNKICMEDSKLMSVKLKLNNTLYGLHF